jgi:hypothetical protein
VSADAIREVGIMDPIFGRGYCEEVDWCQRARLAGYRNVLSLGSFVFHEGSGTNREEGLLAHGMTTIAEHELIILGRYPDYRTNIDRFLDERNLEELGTDALSRALTLLARESGYELVVSDSHSTVTTGAVRVLMPGDDARRPAHVSINGVSAPLSPPEPSAPGLRWWSPQAIEDVVGLPTVVEVFEPGAAGKAVSEWARSAGIAVIDHVSYPTRI